MKQLVLSVALITISLSGNLHAQSRVSGQRTNSVFNISDDYIYNTHTVYLEHDAKMIIEMADVTDYVMLKGIDSLVRQMRFDIDFYKDSLTALDNVRIDYAIRLESDNTMIRFKKYSPDGDIYVKRHGELSKMKVERDTIRLIVRKAKTEHNSRMHFYDFPVQVTFILNNYTDLDSVLKYEGLLEKITDTLAARTIPKVYDPNISEHRTEIEYHPFSHEPKMENIRLDGEGYNTKKYRPRKIRSWTLYQQ